MLMAMTEDFIFFQLIQFIMTFQYWSELICKIVEKRLKKSDWKKDERDQTVLFNGDILIMYIRMIKLV